MQADWNMGTIILTFNNSEFKTPIN